MSPEMHRIKHMAQLLRRSPRVCWRALQLAQIDLESQLAINQPLDRMQLAPVALQPIAPWLWLDSAAVSLGEARPS